MIAVKKVFSVFLIVVFLYNISGFYITFLFQQSGNRVSVENTLKEKSPPDLIVIKIAGSDKKNITWKGNDELSMNGKLYDIAFKKQEGNVLLLYCYNDTKEESLFASLEKHIKNHFDSSSTSGNSSKSKVKNPLTHFLNDFNNNAITFFKTDDSAKTIYRFSVLNFTLKYPDPPPRLV